MCCTAQPIGRSAITEKAIDRTTFKTPCRKIRSARRAVKSVPHLIQEKAIEFELKLEDLSLTKMSIQCWSKYKQSVWPSLHRCKTVKKRMKNKDEEGETFKDMYM